MIRSIDWTFVTRKLDTLRGDGLKYIKEALTSKETPDISDFDAAMQQIERLKQDIKNCRDNYTV